MWFGRKGSSRRPFGFTEIQRGYQRCVGTTTPFSYEGDSRNTTSEAWRIPAEDGSSTAPVQAPPQPARQLKPRRARRACDEGADGRPGEQRTAVVEFRVNVRAEVEGETDIVGAADDHVDNLEAGPLRIEPH